MKKIFLLFTVYFLLFTLSTGSAVAVSDEKTATSSTRAQEINQRVQERLQKVENQVTTKAFWGTLKAMNDTTLTLDTSKGEQTIKTDDETVFVSGKTPLKLSDLEIGKFLIVMGTTNADSLLAKRILVLAKAPKPAPVRQAVFGKITDISTEEKVLVLTNPKNSGTTFQVKVTDKTVLTKTTAGAVKKVEFAALKIGDRVVAVGTNGNGTLTAKIVHVIPGKAVGLEESIVTPTSGKTTPTPTKKPTQKPTPTPTPSE